MCVCVCVCVIQQYNVIYIYTDSVYIYIYIYIYICIFPDFSDHQNLPLHNEVKGVRHLNKSVPTVQDEDDWQDHKFDDSGVNLDTQMNIQQVL